MVVAWPELALGIITVYDRMDAAATINFSVHSGAATIRERRLFRSERVQKFKSIIIDIIIQAQG